MQHTFNILLAPVPASRPRVPRYGKPFYPKTYASWRESAADYLACDTALTGPLCVQLDVICKRPQKLSTAIPPGDVDNYAKAALDALTAAGVWGDDKQVVELLVRKRYAQKDEQPQTKITIQQKEF